MSSILESNRDRSIEVTGRDIKFNIKGDLSVTSTGDLNYLSGAELIETALLRRLTTPEKGYTRSYYNVDTEEIETIGNSYKNESYQHLSTNLDVAGANIIQALDFACKQEPRINYNGATLQKSTSLGELNFILQYQIKSETELRQLKSSVMLA